MSLENEVSALTAEVHDLVATFQGKIGQIDAATAAARADLDAYIAANGTGMNKIFVDGVGGNDNNAGDTAGYPVATLNEAMQRLDPTRLNYIYLKGGQTHTFSAGQSVLMTYEAYKRGPGVWFAAQDGNCTLRWEGNFSTNQPVIFSGGGYTLSVEFNQDAAGNGRIDCRGTNYNGEFVFSQCAVSINKHATPSNYNPLSGHWLLRVISTGTNWSKSQTSDVWLTNTSCAVAMFYNSGFVSNITLPRGLFRYVHAAADGELRNIVHNMQDNF